MSTNQILILVLAIISFSVFILLLSGSSTWLLVCLYWLVLTLKNVHELYGYRRKGARRHEKKAQ